MNCLSQLVTSIYYFIKMLAIIVVGLATIVILWKNRKFIQISRKLQHGIKSYPFLGVSYLFFGNGEVHMRAIKRIGQETIRKGGIIAAWFGPRFYISVADPVLAEIILKSCLEKDDITRFTREGSGTGSIFAPVPIWRPRRKALMPIFSSRNLSNFVEIFAKQSEILMEQLENKPVSENIAMWSYLFAYASDSVAETALGVQLYMQKNHAHPFMTALSQGTKLIASRTCQPWLHSDLVYKRLPSYKRFREIAVYTRNFINEVIISKTKQLNYPNKSLENHNSLLEMLLASSASQRLSDLELQDEMLTFFVAGTETSAVGIGFTLLMMAKHQDVQERVYDELKTVIGSSTRSITSEDLPKLKYLDVIIKETLRLYPPGVVVLRKIDKEVALPNSVTIPSGCGAVIHIWALHRNPRYWGADADQFRPERFLDTPLKHPAQYIPFSYGPRSCIGYQFATLSMKTALATMLLRYRVLPTNNTFSKDPLRLKFDFMLKDVDNFSIRLERRF